MDKSNVNLTRKVKFIQKFSRDLLRLNDPLAGWGESERYHQYLTWGRTTLSFGMSLVIVGLLAWVYVQLRQDPYQQFLRACQQQGLDTVTCGSQWDKRKL